MNLHANGKMNHRNVRDARDVCVCMCLGVSVRVCLLAGEMKGASKSVMLFYGEAPFRHSD